MKARRRPVLLVAAALLGLAAGCTTPDPEYTRTAPDEPAIPLSAPTGGSRLDFDIDRFDPCAPFRNPVWNAYAIRVDEPAPDPAGCRFQGRGMSATIGVESGRNLAEISADPRFRPGGTGSMGNRYWRTGTSDAVHSCHAFLAVGPAQPDRVVHLFAETDGPAAAVRPPSYPDQHACQFVERLTSVTGDILQSAASTPR